LPPPYAAFRNRLGLNEARLSLAVGRYFNDRQRLLDDHDIEKYLHRSKMVAYTIKWILAAAPIYSNFTRAEMDGLPEKVQERIVNINYIFCTLLIFDGLEELDKKDFTEDAKYGVILRDLVYCMQTQVYAEKIAAILFHTLSIHATEGT